MLTPQRGSVAERNKLREEIRLAALRLSHSDLIKLHRSLNEIVYAANLEKYAKHEGVQRGN